MQDIAENLRLTKASIPPSAEHLAKDLQKLLCGFENSQKESCFKF